MLLFLFPQLWWAGSGLCVCLTTLPLRAGADKLVEGLTSLDPTVPCLGWRWAPSLPRRIQTCISHSSMNSSMNSEWGIIKSVCPVSYTPVKPNWLKASTFQFCSPFTGNYWFCDFILFGGLIILSLFLKSVVSIWTGSAKGGPSMLPRYAPGTLSGSVDWNILRRKESPVSFGAVLPWWQPRHSCSLWNTVVRLLLSVLNVARFSSLLWFFQSPALLMFINILTCSLALYVGSMYFLLF